MKITLPLTGVEEAKFKAKARAEGTTPENLVRQALEPIIASFNGEDIAQANKPTKSMLGMLAKYGPAPSSQDIDENRHEMFSNFGRHDIV